ncbi:MAG: ankyrin repeat domain-containing protein [Cyanothece sp. SIO2G6]|nr:ankyrin repeat domain-containing protein [Cyanothece sp. SIO2G6]
MVKVDEKFLELEYCIRECNFKGTNDLLTSEENCLYLDWDENLEDYEPLLEQAIRFGNIDFINLFIEKGLHLPFWHLALESGLELATRLGKFEMAEILLAAGANPRKGRSEPPIIYASSSKNIEFVKLLIKSGADVNAPAEGGFTALMAAAISGSLDMVQLLVENGAQVGTVCTDKQRTAISLARYYGNEEVVAFLEAQQQ